MTHCVELLVDLPDYFRPVHGRDPTGFLDVMPAVRVQLGPLPGGIVFSATAGLGFPTGASRISGSGYNPYIQFPWTREIGGGWGLSGCLHSFGLRARRAMRSPKRRLSWNGTSGPTRTYLSSMLAIARTTASEPTHQFRRRVSVYRHSANRFSRGLRTNQQIAELFLWLGLLDPVRWPILTGSAQKKRRPLGRLRAVSVISDRRHHVRSRRPPRG